MYSNVFVNSYPSFEEGRLEASLAWIFGVQAGMYITSSLQLSGG